MGKEQIIAELKELLQSIKDDAQYSKAKFVHYGDRLFDGEYYAYDKDYNKLTNLIKRIENDTE